MLAWLDASAFVSGGLATLVFGEPDPGATTAYQSGFTNKTLFHPSGVAVDSSGNLFVADSGANRVLEYDSPFNEDDVADRVYGTCGSFIGGTCAGMTVSNATLSNPTSVAIDGGNNLWVVDAGDNRVLEYVNPIAGGSLTTASLVLGQLGIFSSTGCNLGGASPTADSLCFTGFDSGVVVDTAGNVYVGDSGNNRVLEYFSPAQSGTSPGTPGLAADTTADVVYGQNGSFTSNSYQANNGESGASLSAPGAVSLDASSDLYITDAGNQRVLEFTTTTTNPPAAATQVLGQCNSFTGSACPPANIQTTLSETLNLAVTNPSGVAGGLAIDAAGELYVADPLNNRVLVLPSPTSSSTSTFSGRVLGQISFIHNQADFVDGEGYDIAWGVAVDTSVSPNRLWVVDSSNSRVLGYKNVTALNDLNPADVVIGQPDFFSYYPNQFDSTASNSPTAATLALPTAAAVDASGNLYVADTGNSRVLVYLNPFGKGQADGISADLIIGQNGSFTAGTTSAACATTPSAGTLCAPNGLSLDHSGNLYIVDAGFNRVLKFTSPAASPNLAQVLGQPDAMTLNTCSMSVPNRHLRAQRRHRVRQLGRVVPRWGGRGDWHRHLQYSRVGNGSRCSTADAGLRYCADFGTAAVHQPG